MREEQINFQTLVTGGAGFIGSHLCEKTCKKREGRYLR